MFQVLINTILPVFSIILLGYLLKAKQIIHPAFARTANQIVYYLALPAMLLNTTAQSPFMANFNLGAALCLVGALGLVMLFGLALLRLLGIPENSRGTFLQSSFHGNIGFMSYAIAFYALGEAHFASTAILSSFLMVGQNVLAIWMLATFRNDKELSSGPRQIAKHVVQNPIILSVVAGVLYSAVGPAVPRPVKQFLDILSGMALPTALLLIGASLSFGAFRLKVKEIIGIGMLKLICMPLLGYALMTLARVPTPLVLPGLILLASPPATVTYVMATELGGDPKLAATSVSVLTLLSALSYTLVLSAVRG